MNIREITEKDIEAVSAVCIASFQNQSRALCPRKEYQPFQKLLQAVPSLKE